MSASGDVVGGPVVYAARTVFGTPRAMALWSPGLREPSGVSRVRISFIAAVNAVSSQMLGICPRKQATSSGGRIVLLYNVSKFQNMMRQALNVLLPSQTFSSSFTFIHSFLLQADHSFNQSIFIEHLLSFIMKFTALALLALGASTSAYVVPNSKAIEKNAVAARMVVSLPRLLI
jgi:hypothetical protein